MEKYIKHGLDSNLALKQQTFDFQKAKLDLERAKSMFYPRANFNAQYTLATGGRTRIFPIGDLLNNCIKQINTSSQ